MQLTHENALSFVSTIYPNKDWQYQSTDNDVLFFDTLDLNEDASEEEKDDYYEQIYLVKKGKAWEILCDWESGYSSPYKQPYNLSNDIENYMKDTDSVGVSNSIGFDQYNYRYFGSKSQEYVEKFNKDNSKHFLQVVKDGLDFSLPKGERSTFDLAEDIDFDKLALDCHVNHENLLLNYFNYMAHHLCVWLSHVEEVQIYDGITKSNFDDSIVDMLSVLEKIKAANKKADYSVQLNPMSVEFVISNISDFQAEVSVTDYLTDEQVEEVDAILKNLLKEFELFK